MKILDDLRNYWEQRRLQQAERQLAHDEKAQEYRDQLDARRIALADRREASNTAWILEMPTTEATVSVDRPEDRRWSAVTALVVSAALTVTVLGSLVVLLIWLAQKEEETKSENGPASALSLVFVCAAVVLILVVCTLTIVLKRLRLTDANEAMGLPRGSIRAVIALMLILLFFVAAIFLYNSTRDASGDRTQNRVLRHVSAARFAAIPTESIQSSQARTVRGVTVYRVVLYPPSANTTTSDDLAKQLITILGTLVTAVAAFYFGANSLKDAATSLGQASSPGAGGAAAILVPVKPPDAPTPQGGT